MGRILPLAAIAAVLLPIAAHAADVKIGYVDLQRALNEVEEGQSAKARLKAKFEKSQAQLDKEQASLKARKEELDKKRLAMDEATLRQKAEELDKDFVRLSGLYSKLQKELSDEERDVTSQIFARMRALIADLAVKQDFTYVLEMNESGLLFGPPSMDLTNELVRAYNGAHKASAKK
ncbi:MAG TPA: OmpH family outer membrane protein [Vulgatibacter sp.]